MKRRRSPPQFPTAAYLYVLHLDQPALAWEYLRRHPDYRHDWSFRHQGMASLERWGLRMLEDPGLDARDAHPVWFADHDSVLHLYPDVDPSPDARVFDFWSLPGEKRLVDDGRRLMLQVRSPGCNVRLVLKRALEDGMTYALAARHGNRTACGACRTAPAALRRSACVVGGRYAAVGRARPSRTMLAHMHTLQALDGVLTGASCREIAEVMMGTVAVARQWHADSDLRSRVRRLVKRGLRLMGGGYRQLAQLDTVNDAPVRHMQRLSADMAAHGNPA